MSQTAANPKRPPSQGRQAGQRTHSTSSSGRGGSGSGQRPRSGSSGTGTRPRSSSSPSHRPSGQRGQAAAVRRRKKRSKAPVIALLAVLFLFLLIVMVYWLGFIYYKNRFTANTFVNGQDVGGKTFAEAERMFAHSEVPSSIQVKTPTDNTVDLSLSNIGYKYSYSEELEKIYNDIDRKSWFSFLLTRTDYNFSDVASYNYDALMSEIEDADWGSEENQNAQIKSGDDGYYVIPEVQGDVFDMDTLKSSIAHQLDNAVYTVDWADTEAYIPPETVKGDYDAKIETLNKFWNMEINYDFNYTKEKLTGKKLAKMVKVKRDGTWTIDEDKCMEYIEELADKYDTYNKPRKFKATKLGKITVPPSSDAKYGWWLDQKACCKQLIGIIKKGENRKKVVPVYYKDGNFEFTGVPEARSENDDIGKTYLEVDLTNQMWWYYKDGKKKKEGYVVSGQTTSAARTTLPGVYKLWQKDTNYRMKDRNADGEQWDTTCNYWNRIAIVGIGMHDSTWRYGFGGTIYQYDGSHGCINMSYYDAQYVYENVPLGTPVVMYYKTLPAVIS